LFFFFQAEDGIRDFHVTGVQTCALPIFGKVEGAACRVVDIPERIAGRVFRDARPLTLNERAVSRNKRTHLSIDLAFKIALSLLRSEERRVGKECSSRGSRDAEREVM